MNLNATVVLALLSYQGMVAVMAAAGPEVYGLPHAALPWMALAGIPVGVVLNYLDPFGRIRAIAAGKGAASTSQPDLGG